MRIRSFLLGGRTPILADNDPKLGFLREPLGKLGPLSKTTVGPRYTQIDLLHLRKNRLNCQTTCSIRSGWNRCQSCHHLNRLHGNLQNAVVVIALLPKGLPSSKFHLVPYIHFPVQHFLSQEDIHLRKIPLPEITQRVWISKKEASAKPPIHGMQRSHSTIPAPWNVNSRDLPSLCHKLQLLKGLGAISKDVKDSKVNPCLLWGCVLFHGTTHKFRFGVHEHVKPKRIMVRGCCDRNPNSGEIPLSNREIRLGQPFQSDIGRQIA